MACCVASLVSGTGESAPSKDAPEDETFREPSIGIHKVYTRTGDDGTTGLVGGQRVAKDHPRIEAYGTVDELGALVGLARLEAPLGLRGELLQVQHQLFNLGSCLATLPDDIGEAQPRIRQADIDWLEACIDGANGALPPLTSFVLAGGSEAEARLNVARTVCRRGERLLVALHRDGGCRSLEVHYLNRLSDALFVWARIAADGKEVLWNPNAA